MFNRILLLVTILGSVWHLCAQDSIGLYNNEVQRLFKANEYQKLDKVLHNQAAFLQREDNLEEFLYAQWELFSLEPRIERLGIISNIETKTWRKPSNPNEHLAYLHLLVNKAYYSKEFGQLDKAIVAYEKAWQYYQAQPIPSYDIIDFCLKPLATTCIRIGDFTRADEVLKRTLQLAIDKKDNTQISATLGNLAINYHTQGQYNKAIEVLKQALKIPNSTAQESRLRSELARNYVKINAQQKASEQIEKSNTISSKNKENDVKLHLRNQITKGVNLLHADKREEAKNEFYKALDLAKKIYPKHDREVAKIHNLIAAVHFQNSNYTKALNTYQESIKTLIADFNPKNSHENPLPDNLIADNTLIDAFDGKASCFSLQHKHKEAISNYEFSFRVNELIQRVYSSQISKINQQTANRNRTEKILDLLHQNYLDTKDKTNIEIAFLATEKSKAQVLNEERRAKAKENQNDSLVIYKKELAKRLAKLDAQINQAEYTKEISLDSIKTLIKLRDYSRNELQVTEQTIQEQYENTDAIALTLAQIQEKINTTDKTIISYFVGEKQTFIFTITPNNPINWRIIKNTDYHNLAKQLFSFYAKDNGNNISNQIEDFKSVSHQLYRVLLGESLTNNKTQNIIIIPDRLLSFIPFDALITSKTTTTQFDKMNFVINKYTISYAYAATILFQKNNNYNPPTSVIGFFPEFKTNNRGLVALPHTLKEADRIAENWEVDYYKKEKATQTTFEKRSNQNAIIHLSTHAHTFGKTGEATIEFWDKPLTLSEIYGLDIPSDLVVLSACETGIGQQIKGEGTMSLARGFSFAGVNNVVVSLWNVNDKATSSLMGDFYKHLAENTSFEHALQNSKLDYLNNNSIPNTKKSPYYWAGFVPIKNTYESFRVADADWGWNHFFFIVLGVILLFFVVRKINNAILN